ncbi:MAG: RDD family protein [Chitinophagales bacterium]
MQVPSRRIVAFIIDYSIMFCLTGLVVTILLINHCLETVQGYYVFTPIVILFYLKDSVQGASIGKRLMGIELRKYSQPDKIPNLFILFVRNLLIFIWPIELVFFIIDHEHRRLSDRIFDTQVVSNRQEYSV